MSEPNESERMSEGGRERGRERERERERHRAKQASATATYTLGTHSLMVCVVPIGFFIHKKFSSIHKIVK